MAVLLHDRPEAAGQKQREALRLPRTSAVVALFAFSSRMDRDSMRLFARTHGDEVRAAAIASTGQEVLELLHGGLRPQVLVLDALLTKPSVTQVLQEISTMQPDPEPAVLVLVPVPEETAARKALGLFAQYRIMLRPYGMKNLFDEIYRMGTTDDEHRLYHLRRCCEDVLDDFGAQSTLNGYRYAERMLLYALYAERPQKIGDLQQYVASEENIEIGTVTSALNRMSAGMSKRGAEPYRGLCLRCGRPENGVLSNGQLFEGLLCTPGRLCYRDNGPGLPPDAAALLTEGQWSERLLHAGGLGLPLVAAYTSAMGWALTVGEGPGMSLQFTLPAAPPLDGMVLTSPTERLADRQNRRRLIRRELAVLVADTSMQ